MKRLALALVVLLLSIAVAGFPGCGKKSNTITSITVSPADAFLAKGRAHQFIATVHFTDGKSLPFWTQVTWSTSDPTVATVSSTGVVFAVTEGTVVITATDIARPSIACSVTATVTDLLSITVTPSLVSLPTGTVQSFTAMGAYSAATPSWPPDLTTMVLWASSDTAIAVVSNATGSQGFATTVSAGTATITAVDLFTGMTGTAILNVTP